GLTELFDLYPSALSGGEKRRLSLARGLLLPARLLLLDEPLAYLDDAWGERVMELVMENVRNSRMTMVVATHQQLPGAKNARVIRMERGKVVEDNDRYH
ncbi:MAG TPA: ATP-binding cassette domain-containing protein, partial [Geobacteraceae bacterium]|nr:ATP-binding cassette domain-containing protein [Geobacteraceae bacterium]